MTNSWIGATWKLEETIADMSPDKDEATGAILVRGGQPFFGIGGDEVVVPDTCEVRVRGEWVRLIAHLPDSVMVAVF